MTAEQRNRRAAWRTVVEALGPVALVLFVARPTEAADEKPVARIEVKAPRISATQASAPTAFTTEIDVAEEARTAETVADLLSDTVGVQVRRFGGPGSLSTISIRGSSANHVRFYLDGIPLTRARNESVNLSNLPLDALDRIDVYRGSAPVSFGSAGIGGVVDLVTRPAADDTPPVVSVGFGSFGTRKLGVSAGARLGEATSVLGSFAYDGSEGDFRFDARNPATGDPVEPKRRLTRENNEFDAVDLLLKGRHALDATWEADSLTELFWKEQGVPGFGGSQSRDASLEQYRVLQSLRLSGGGLVDDSLDLSARAFGVFEQDHFEDRLGDGEVGQLPQDRRDSTVVAGVSTDGLLASLPMQVVGWSVEASYETFMNDMELSGAQNQPDARRWHFALGLQDQFEPLPEWILLVPTVRYEHLYDRGPTFGRTSIVESIDSSGTDLVSASIGAQSRPLSWLTVKGNLARVERAPNFSELYGNQGSVISNPGLDPETALNRDVGFVAEMRPPVVLDRVRLEYAYFNNDVDDMIVFVANSQFVVQPQNVGGARLRGHEVSVSASAFGHVGIDANYTHQDATNLTDSPSEHGKQLPGRPQDEVFLRLEYRHRLGRPFYELNLIAGNYLDRSNLRPKIDQRDLHALGIALTPRDWIELTLEARNLSDDQTSDVFGFPLPGRAFYGGMKVRL